MRNNDNRENNKVSINNNKTKMQKNVAVSFLMDHFPVSNRLESIGNGLINRKKKKKKQKYRDRLYF